MTLEKQIVNTSTFDPFVEEPCTDLFKAWVIKSADEFGEYQEELVSYREKVPDFMYKSADKFILRALELYSKEKIDKPATEFYKALCFLKQRMELWNKEIPFVDFIYQRMKENMELLEQFRKEETKKLVIPILKDRGFL